MAMTLCLAVSFGVPDFRDRLRFLSVPGIVGLIGRNRYDMYVLTCVFGNENPLS
jgi:hypothetical protein